jgi:hypothetical protein
MSHLPEPGGVLDPTHLATLLGHFSKGVVYRESLKGRTINPKPQGLSMTAAINQRSLREPQRLHQPKGLRAPQRLASAQTLASTKVLSGLRPET